jgi:CSLREA domain-containing protein
VIAVNTFVDGSDANPTDGVCEMTAGVGDCSLRAAVDEANAATGTKAVTIAVPSGTYVLTQAGADDTNAAGDLDLYVTEHGVNLDGAAPGVRVDANGADAGIDVRGGQTDLYGFGFTGASGPGIDVHGGRARLFRGASFANTGAGARVAAGSALHLESVTLSGNGGNGAEVAGTLNVSYSTITANAGGISGPGVTNSGADIIADQTSGADCAGTVVSNGGYNMDSDGSCGFAGTGDITVAEAKLAPLNSALVPYHRPEPGSAAIDVIGTGPTCAGGPLDATGTARPVGPDCDRGAVEANYTSAPTANADAATVGEDGPGASVDVLANDNDPDVGDTKTVTAVDTSGTLGTVTNNGTDVTYDPNGTFEALGAGDTATDTFSYTMADAFGNTSGATVTVTINGTNDGPTANADAGTLSEDGPAVTVDVLANDTDPDTGDTKTVQSVDTTGTLGTVTNNGTNVSYDPNGAFEALKAAGLITAAVPTGTDTFTYTMIDGSGATSTATVTMTITHANDAPTAVADSADANEDGPGITVDVLANDTDPDALDSKTVQSVDATGTVGRVTNNGTNVSYDPNGQFDALAVGATATDTFTYTMVDGGGLTSTATVTVTINGQNDGPTANDDTATINEDAGATAVLVLGNDTDPDAGDVPFVFSVTQPPASGAGVTNNGTQVTYNPLGVFNSLKAGETASDSFTYTVSDGHGGSSTATVNVTVTGQNDGPTAVADTGSVNEDGPGTTINVLTNDTDPDSGDTQTVLTVNVTGTLGSVSFTGTDVTYNPNGAFNSLKAGATATDTFTYTMVDGSSAASTATVTITVTGQNDAPTAVNDSASTNEDATNVAIDVLGNDTDPDIGDTKSVQSVGALSNGGSITNNGTNVTFTPGASFQDLQVGQTRDTAFSYTMVDGSGATSSASVTITVTGVNDAPVANNDGTYAGVVGNTKATLSDASAGPKVTLTGNLLNQNDTDPDAGDTKTASLVNANGAAVTVNSNGSFVFTPAPGAQNGNVTFTYKITDSQGASSNNATVTLNVVERVWWVDSSLGSNGNGTSTSPFSVLSSAAASDDSGDYVFLKANNTYTGGIDLNSSERLYGEPNGLSVTGAASSPIVAANAGLTNPNVTNTTVSPFRAVGVANDVDIQRVNISSASGDGVAGTGVTNLTIGANTTISGNGGTEFKVTGAAGGTIAVASTISNGAAGATIDVQNRNSGTVTFTGAISSTGGGAGVNLNSNAGASIAFTNALSLSTGTSPAFSATAGGTVTNSSGSVNTLTTSSAAALTVQNTTIGAGGLTFRSIDSGAGASNGITLDTTGNSGGLIVTGTGAAPSGGTISGKTGSDGSTTSGTGIYLNSTNNVSLNGMNIQGNQNYGIRGTTVDGFTLANTTAGTTSTNGTNDTTDADPTSLIGGEGTIRFKSLTGTVSFNNVQLDRGLSRTVMIQNTASGTLNLNVTNSTINQSLTSNVSPTNASDAMFLDMEGTAASNLTVTNSNFLAWRQFGIQGRALNSATMTYDIHNNKFANGNTAPVNASASLSFGGSGFAPGADIYLQANIHDNTFRHGADGSATAPTNGGAHLVFGLVSGAGKGDLKFQNNTVGVNGVVGSGAGNAADALRLFSSGNQGSTRVTGTTHSRYLVTGNTIQRYGEVGIQLNARQGNSIIDATITGNIIRQPGTAALGAFGAIWVNAGALAADTNQVNVAIGGTSAGDKNTMQDSDPNNYDDVFLDKGTCAGCGSSLNLYRNGSLASGSGEALVKNILNDLNNPSLDLMAGFTNGTIGIQNGLPQQPT